VTTLTGETVQSITIKKGTVVSSPIRAINRSEAFWGPTAKEFLPERWLSDDLKDVPCLAKQLSGTRHILTFSDGPRLCLGRSFALAEFKVCISIACSFIFFDWALIIR
jgi:cytochrome P450